MSIMATCCNCGEKLRSGLMTTCKYTQKSYCGDCDSVLVTVQNKRGLKSFVHKDLVDKLVKERPEEEWVKFYY